MVTQIWSVLDDNVVVGDNVAVGIDDEAGADGAIDRLQQGGEFFGVDAVGSQGVIGFDLGIGGGDGDDRRCDVFGNVLKVLFEVGER